MKKTIKLTIKLLLICNLLFSATYGFADYIRLLGSLSLPNTIIFPKEFKTLSVSKQKDISEYQTPANKAIVFSFKSNAKSPVIINVFLIDGSVMSYMITPQKNTSPLIHPPRAINSKKKKSEHHYRPNDYVSFLKSIHHGTYKNKGFSYVTSSRRVLVNDSVDVINQGYISNSVIGALIIEIKNNTLSPIPLSPDDFVGEDILAIELNEDYIQSGMKMSVVVVFSESQK